MPKSLPPIPTATPPTPPPKFSAPPSPALSDVSSSSSSSWHSAASTLPSSPESASCLHPSYAGSKKEAAGGHLHPSPGLHPTYTGGLPASREVSAGSYVVVGKPAISKSCVRFADVCVVIPGKCKLKKSGTKGKSVLSSFLNAPTPIAKSLPVPTSPCLRRHPSLPNLGRARSNTTPSMPPLPSKTKSGTRTDSLQLVSASPTLPAIQRDLLKSVRKTLTRSGSSQKRPGGLVRSHSASSKSRTESEDEGTSSRMSPSSLPPKMSRSKPCTVSLRACCEACLRGMAEEEETFTDGARRLLAGPTTAEEEEEDGAAAARRRGRLMKRMSVDELEGAPLAEGLAKMHVAMDESEDSDEELFPLPSRKGIPPSLSRSKVPEVAVDSGVESGGCSSPEEDAFPLPKRRVAPSEDDDGLFPLPTSRKRIQNGMRVSSV
ncbi:hypothetical protein CYLTODRAFT_489675 [Cylindrobasidium torrendii FP15055 ss-10]|uniref:Uncharacterized protein n=1 Tax=Cylindrobasidium torrendii FP15055 ss-10 TaxID=1314674 RepID=A0A0D7BDG8_9AGAR|nr:hypothetical protein CYLTODRAFT_489675 [Cylindrobasidium torrendii FP15055 ss-10]